MRTDSTFDYAFFALLGFVVFAASFFDWRERRIPNALILFGLVSGLLLSAFEAGMDGLLTAMLGLLVGLLLLLPGFAMRFTGAGDVKLLATLGVFLGPVGVFKVFLVSMLLGGAFVLLNRLFSLGSGGLVQHLGRYRSMLLVLVKTGQWVYVSPNPGSSLKQRLPMAPVYATAVCVALASSHSFIGIGLWR